MPRRDDIKSILIIGSGPIIIGQACEFDYSGTQACRALKEDGYKVILVNSNPATIMTDPEFADRTYIEPITPEFVEKVIEKERPTALLPTLGGQTGLNVAIELHRRGVLKKYDVEMIGATPDVIEKAEDRNIFKRCMEKIGLRVPRSRIASTIKEAYEALEFVKLPCVIRPAFTLGGTGGGFVDDIKNFESAVLKGLQLSLIHQVLIEESVYGWKEYELEVMRDKKGNVVIVCSIENFDPMGIHTGDSITVAPAQTLTDKEYQALRDAAIKIMREIGVSTGGSNIQFAVNPENGEFVVIEMNPRVSRSSALASKATGFPIAKIAAKLAVGYTLDEIPNDITKKTPACFEPSIDYCVVKIPRWAFEKFPESDPSLSIQMKSVGETMAIGRTFKEAIQKAIRSLDIGYDGFGLNSKNVSKQNLTPSFIREKLSQPLPERLFYIYHALENNFSIEKIHNLTKIDRWFLHNLKEIQDFEKKACGVRFPEEISAELIYAAKRFGYQDKQLAKLLGTTEKSIRAYRKGLGILPTYKKVDTCAGEFPAYTPYYYSTYEEEDEIEPSDKKKIMILGGGPNRIGQGIEFDYCCVQAVFALRGMGYEVIMVNSNPETVSTDYDISDYLFFEPLTKEDVVNIYERMKPEGVILQFGGQTPLNLAKQLRQEGVRILGTSPEDIDRAEDREKFNAMIRRLNLLQPPGGTATDPVSAKKLAKQLGLPVLIRPSYVLGGRAMQIVYDEDLLDEIIDKAFEASPDSPVLIDKFIEGAIEVDVDAVSDGNITVVGGILEHIEEAGVHSGDATMIMPPFSLSERQINKIKEQTQLLAKELNVKGLINIQFVVDGEKIYVIEVNPRASRTVPFVSKATGVPLAKIAACVIVGKNLNELNFTHEVEPIAVCTKQSVFPFNKLFGGDVILGPEMKSTGEVMGIGENLGSSLAKAFCSIYRNLPASKNVFISVRDSDKRDIIFIAEKISKLGFTIYSTSGTAKVLSKHQIPAKKLLKIAEGSPNALDMINKNEFAFIINTPGGKETRKDEVKIRSTATLKNIPVITTIAGAQAFVHTLQALKNNLDVKPLQDFIYINVR